MNEIDLYDSWIYCLYCDSSLSHLFLYIKTWYNIIFLEQSHPVQALCCNYDQIYVQEIIVFQIILNSWMIRNTLSNLINLIKYVILTFFKEFPYNRNGKLTHSRIRKFFIWHKYCKIEYINEDNSGNLLHIGGGDVRG